LCKYLWTVFGSDPIFTFSYRLTIPAAELTDAGEYEVQAVNSAGKAASSAHAEVDGTPDCPRAGASRD
jgi:hypothetical protein